MGKRTFRTFLLALLLCAMTRVSAWAESAVVTGSDVNMREGPGTNFRVVDCLPRGERVMVTDRSNASWYRVEHDGTVGFMSASFLDIAEEEVEQAVTVNQSSVESVYGPGQKGYVDAMYVRFRSAPGPEYSVRGEYNRGKELTYYFTTGDWAACIIDGVPGYIYADYIALGSFGGWGEAQSYPVQTQNPIYSPPEEEQPPQGGTDELAYEHATSSEVEQTPGYINANYVRFRKGPASSYPIIETYSSGKVVGITGVYQDWLGCIIDDAFGWVYADFVTIPEQYGSSPGVDYNQVFAPTQTVQTVTTATMPVPTPSTYLNGSEGYVAGNNVRMRSAPSMSASIVAELSYGNALTIVGVTGDWTAVVCNNSAGYIYSQYVKQGRLTVTEAADNSGGSGGSGVLSGSSLDRGKQIAWYAYQLVGCPYSWGGRDPSGFDCSGLVYYVYQHFGITLNRVAQDQALNGVHVDPDNLQPGDILCFYSGSSYIGHSGIYLGYGMFVHAQNSATGVVVTELAGHYSDRGFEARRIV